MGSFDVKKNKFHYKNPGSKFKYGVIAPYIIKNNLEITSQKDIFESDNAEIVLHEGSWFDIGDYDSLLAASNWRQKNNITIATLRKMYLPYRFIKNNLQLLFMR